MQRMLVFVHPDDLRREGSTLNARFPGVVDFVPIYQVPTQCYDVVLLPDWRDVRSVIPADHWARLRKDIIPNYLLNTNGILIVR